MNSSYQEYKSVDLPWLKEIPSHWEVKRAKYLLSKNENVSIGEAWKSTQLLSLTQRGVIKKDINENKGKTHSDYSTYQPVSQGDFVFCLFDIDETPRTVGLSKHSGMITSAYSTFKALPNVDSDFYYYFFEWLDGFKGLKPFYKGMRKTVRPPEFLNIKIIKPSFYEQLSISKFLNKETQRIDTLISEKQNFINLLKEKRQALISHVVTKGLDPDVEMRDSGLLWAPKIPGHWSVKKLSYICKMQSGDSITSEGIEETGSYPVFGGNGVRGYCESYNHNGDYILIGRQGSLCGNINYASGKFFASEHAVVVYPEKNVVMKWLGETLSVMDLIQYSVSAAIPGLSVSNILQLKVPHPPESEQLEISQHIQSQTNYIDKLIDEVDVSVDLLKEHRTALISAAVTGKIDLRKQEVA